MENFENCQAKNGTELFVNFVQNVPEDAINFDYFNLLDHISQNKIDKDLIAAIFCESIFLFHNLGNKPFEKNSLNK